MEARDVGMVVGGMNREWAVDMGSTCLLINGGSTSIWLGRGLLRSAQLVGNARFLGAEEG